MVQKVMALGDSLTMGVRVSGGSANSTEDQGEGGYRFVLDDALESNGFDVDFVGTLNPVNATNGTSSRTFDTDHLGLRRWTVDELLNGDGPANAVTAIPTPPTQNIDAWLAQYTPDVVLLMAGTNDVVLTAQSTSGITAELETLVRKIAASGASVVLASPPPINFNVPSGLRNGSLDASEPAELEALADSLATLATTLKRDLGSQFEFIDVFNTIDPITDLGQDGLHLTDLAYNKVAQKWYNAMVPMLSPGAGAGTRETPLILEAEAFDTIDPSYRPEAIADTNATVLSLAHLRSRAADPNIEASASTAVSVNSGKFDVILRYFDERDGAGRYRVSVGNRVIADFTTSTDAGLNTSAKPSNYIHRTIATGVDINNGDRITVTYLTDAGESRSFDNIQLVRVGNLTAPPNGGGGNNGGGNNGGNNGGGNNGGGVTPIIPPGNSGTPDDSVEGIVVVGEVANPLRINFRGNKGRRIVGTNRRDRLRGTTKNDRMIGRNNNDRMIGLSGNDRVFGGNGNDNVQGRGGDDFLRGDRGRDRLTGGSGSDRLWGGNDNNRDILRGGSGQDSFVFRQLRDTSDTILDFESGIDSLDIRRVLSGAQYSGSGAEKLSEFVRLVQAGSNTEVRIDSDGIQGSGEFTTLTVLRNVDATTMVSTDFVI